MDSLDSAYDSSSIAGMGMLVDTTGIAPGYNPLDFEDQIINGQNAYSNQRKKESFVQELDNQLERLDAELSGPTSSSARQLPTMGNFNTSNLGNGGNGGFNSSEIDQLFANIDAPLPSSNFSSSSSSSNSFNYNNYNNTPRVDEGMFEDPSLNFMTNEERRQNVVRNVFDEFNKEGETDSNVPVFSIAKEKEEDEKQRNLEQISFLRETLMEEGEDLSRIPNVNSSNSLSEIEAVLKHLVLKNDRKRCCSFAEECILLGAHAIEWIFDGKKTYFGYKPDMVDWHKSVQTKLRRMRHDTSNVVSSIMSEYKMGSGTRIALELLPSMFLYSKMRKSQHNDTITEDEFNDATNKLRDIESSL